MRPPDEQVRRSLVDQWVQKADQDMRAAESLLADEPPLLYPSCFHSQQGAEKYLKALLTWREVEFPKTHVIGELLDLVATVDAQLAESLAGATALSPYGVEVRYPTDQPEPDHDEAVAALALASQVQKAILPALPAT